MGIGRILFTGVILVMYAAYGAFLSLLSKWSVVFPEPLPESHPYRGLAKRMEEGDQEARHEVEEALIERDRYLHALEAIAVVDHDPLSQRIAMQALKAMGRGGR